VLCHDSLGERVELLGRSRKNWSFSLRFFKVSLLRKSHSSEDMFLCGGGRGERDVMMQKSWGESV
jgi:hypothetical protein